MALDKTYLMFWCFFAILVSSINAISIEIGPIEIPPFVICENGKPKLLFGSSVIEPEATLPEVFTVQVIRQNFTGSLPILNNNEGPKALTDVSLAAKNATSLPLRLTKNTVSTAGNNRPLKAIAFKSGSIIKETTQTIVGKTNIETLQFETNYVCDAQQTPVKILVLAGQSVTKYASDSPEKLGGIVILRFEEGGTAFVEQGGTDSKNAVPVYLKIIGGEVI